MDMLELIVIASIVMINIAFHYQLDVKTSGILCNLQEEIKDVNQRLRTIEARYKK